MRIGKTIKREGIIYTVYKIDTFGRCFAEDEFGINIICLPNLIRIK